jgi:hypothetical protein
MKKESILKKEFAQRDINRLRNLVQGKYGDKITSSVGYIKPSLVKHSEGEQWEEDGRLWTIRNGVQENITKLDEIKNLAIPLFCPKCDEIMDKQLDTHYFKSYGECLHCRTKFETTLKINGEWESYVTNLHNGEIDSLISEYTQFFRERMEESTSGYVSEQGEIQKWVGGVDIQQAEQTLQDVIGYLEKQKK